MSKLVAPNDFAAYLQKTTSVFSPVSARTIEAWKSDLEVCLKRLHYMQIARLAGGGQFDRMMNYRGNLTVTTGVLSAVKADIERIWSVDVALGTESQHTFFDSPSGFEFKSIAMNSSDEFLTLRILVVDSPKE